MWNVKLSNKGKWNDSFVMKRIHRELHWKRPLKRTKIWGRIVSALTASLSVSQCSFRQLIRKFRKWNLSLHLQPCNIWPFLLLGGRHLFFGEIWHPSWLWINLQILQFVKCARCSKCTQSKLRAAQKWQLTSSLQFLAVLCSFLQFFAVLSTAVQSA